MEFSDKQYTYMFYMDNNYMYNIIRLIREKLPWLVNILNSAIIYPFRRLKTEYFYKKNPNQIYSFYFEGKKGFISPSFSQ